MTDADEGHIDEHGYFHPGKQASPWLGYGETAAAGSQVVHAFGQTPAPAQEKEVTTITHKSEDGGATWVTITAPITEEDIRRIVREELRRLLDEGLGTVAPVP